jgi:hypothetical protein
MKFGDEMRLQAELRMEIIRLPSIDAREDTALVAVAMHP